MYVRIENGTLDPVHDQDECVDLRDVVGGNVEAVRVPPPPGGGAVLGYVRRDPGRSLPPNCRLPGMDTPVRGPLVIVGLDGDAHRDLVRAEWSAYALEPGADGVPTLVVKS